MQATRTEQTGLDILFAIFAGKTELDQLAARHVAAAIRRERPLVLAIDDIDHPAALMRRQRYASSQMRHDQIGFFIFFTQFRRHFSGNSLHVECMRHADPLKPRRPGNPGDRLQFVDGYGIDDKSGNAEFASQCIGDNRSKIRRVFAAFRLLHLLHHGFIHLIRPAVQRFHQAAAANHRMERRQFDPSLGKLPSQQINPVGILVKHAGKSFQFVSMMFHRLFDQNGFALKYGEFS